MSQGLMVGPNTVFSINVQTNHPSQHNILLWLLRHSTTAALSEHTGRFAPITADV